MIRLASFSPCRLYRYRLSRIWDASKWKQLVVIGLNPSTADESVDDPTIRRCIRFAQREGCGELVMVNLFALRATDPREMLKHEYPVSERRLPGHNDFTLMHASRPVEELERIVVAAWGAHGGLNGRSDYVRRELSLLGVVLRHFGLTKSGEPRHPLYLRADTQIEVWS